jgi:LysR family nitrogen assimilation transcriptional regulator
VAPTEAGRALYLRARAILRHVQITKEEVRVIGGMPLVGQVAVGMPAIISQLIATPFIARMRNLYPALLLKVLDGSSVLSKEMLRHGRLDLALLYLDERESGLRASRLVVEELYFASIGFKADQLSLAQQHARGDAAGGSRATTFKPRNAS